MTERMTEEPYDPMTERMTEAQLLPVSEQPHAVGTVVTIKPVTILEKDVAAINVRVRAETQGDPTWRDHLFYNWFSNLWPACLCSSTCTCIPLIQMSHRMKFMSWPNSLSGFVGLITLSIVLWMYCEVDTFIAVYFFAFYLAWGIRDKIRTQDSISGFSVVDATYSFFCIPCVVSHEMRHLYGYQQVVECDLGIYTIDGPAGVRNTVVPIFEREDQQGERCAIPTPDNV
jgi:hypothetical protein